LIGVANIHLTRWCRQPGQVGFSPLEADPRLRGHALGEQKFGRTIAPLEAIHIVCRLAQLVFDPRLGLTSAHSGRLFTGSDIRGTLSEISAAGLD